MTYLCHIDKTQHDSIEALHTYIKSAYRLSQKSYWTTYEPRCDLLTGELIPFKDYEQYSTTDFLNKNNLKKWIKNQPREIGLTWAKKWLSQRRANKGLIYAPCQAELRTLCCPTMPYYEAVAADEGGYYGVTATLGFQPRYTKTSLTNRALPVGAIIIQDTREQAPVKLSVPTIIDTLNVGDYALAAPHDRGIRIERKSLSDFCGTLSGRKQLREGKNTTTEWSNLERFDRELARATEAGLYVVMMVEANINDAQRFDYLPQTKWVKAKPAYIFKNLRDLLVKYPLSFQVVFVDGKKDMAEKILRVLELGSSVRQIDLQFAQEEGLYVER